MAEAGVPAGPVLDLAEALRHPQARALGAFRPVPVPGEDLDVPVADLPLRFSRSKAGIESPPPEAGRDGRAILEALGYDAKSIADLETRGVI